MRESHHFWHAIIIRSHNILHTKTNINLRYKTKATKKRRERERAQHQKCKAKVFNAAMIYSNKMLFI